MEARDILIETIQGRGELWKVAPFIRLPSVEKDGELASTTYAYATLITLDPGPCKESESAAKRALAYNVVIHRNNLDGGYDQQATSGWLTGTVDDVIKTLDSLIVSTPWKV